MSKRNKLRVGGGATVVIVGLVVISAGARRDRGVEVRFEQAGRRDLVAAVTASGKIQPKKKVDISADITGRITRIAVREGDLVTKGQFLLQIDPTIYQANLQQAEATLASSQAAAVQAKANRDQADRALGRTKELHTQNPNLVSQEQLEQAQTAFDIAEANLTAAQHQVDQARAAVRSASDNLRKTTLLAPMAGRVTRLSVEEGEVAVPGTFSIPIIALTVRENKPLSTENRPVDTATARKKKEAEGVFVVDKGTATFRPVKVGIAGDEYFEVLDGLKEGETIVAGPYQAIRDLKDGARVRALKQAADTAKKIVKKIA